MKEFLFDILKEFSSRSCRKVNKVDRHWIIRVPLEAWIRASKSVLVVYIQNFRFSEQLLLFQLHLKFNFVEGKNYIFSIVKNDYFLLWKRTYCKHTYLFIFFMVWCIFYFLLFCCNCFLLSSIFKNNHENVSSSINDFRVILTWIFLDCTALIS